MAELAGGRVFRLHVSRDGVPKRPVESAAVSADGLAGDAQRDLRHHGGPDRAVSVFSREVIERVAGEGHPLAPGGAGENVLVENLDWNAVVPGARLVFEGGVELEVTSYCMPCRNIAGSFLGGRSERISQKLHPGQSRVYTRVS